ncbi:hypothetical protein TrRE_jg5708 [Triparma retinervis]|uniref:General transcription factor IIH subunit 4 n=1 Tax=Triparma retinervis TaxID=2557542 RepID=A0A9W6ZCN6_9STRA|nr:hypothetical protein TrRE_jg5708 [Triparma retinervis]
MEEVDVGKMRRLGILEVREGGGRGGIRHNEGDEKNGGVKKEGGGEMNDQGTNEEGKKRERIYALCPAYYHRLRISLSLPDPHPMPYTGPPLPSVSPSTLDEYQSTTFNAILNYMVGDTSVDLDADLVNFLVTKGLMTVDGSGNGSISGAGYEFMLLGERGRIWGLCREYLLGLTGPSLCTAVLMLASMATARKGRGCGIDKIPRDALQHMPVFKRLGMVYFNKGERVWYPTGAATEMGGGEGDVKVDAAAALNLPDPLGSSHLAIIVQTNFSVVAYTTTALHVKMMSLFVDPASFLFLPNMVMGSITRESVKDAMAKGIKASQIVGFLKGNMHPCLRGESFPVPENRGGGGGENAYK